MSFLIFRRTRVSMKKEAYANFLTDSLDRRSTPRSADVMVYESAGGKLACVDLAEVSSLVRLVVGAFTIEQTALKVASSKEVKHEKVCYDNQHAFILFAFETFGFLTPEVVDLLHKVQRVMHLMSCTLDL